MWTAIILGILLFILTVVWLSVFKVSSIESRKEERQQLESENDKENQDK